MGHIRFIVECRSARALAIGLAAGIALGAMAPLPAAADDSPSGMVSFFMATTCPDGWVLSTAAQGRLLLMVTEGAQVGKQLGTPMQNQTAPTFSHGYGVTLNSPSKSISGAASCCNDQGAPSGKFEFEHYRTDNSSAQLPFMQLLVCEKQ